MTLAELITRLQKIKKELGNVPVILSSDSEGNSFGTLEKQYSFFRSVNLEGDKVLGLIIYPYVDGCCDEYEAFRASKEK